VKNDLVVERASVKRMGVTNDGSVCGVVDTNIQDGFKASGAAFQEQRSNS
jgi:hypothetical protein